MILAIIYFALLVAIDLSITVLSLKTGRRYWVNLLLIKDVTMQWPKLVYRLHAITKTKDI